MRIQHWLAPVLSTLLLLALCHSSSAQTPIGPTYSPSGMQSFSGATFDGGAASHAAGPSVMGPPNGGYPPSHGAWPGVYGPYENAFEQVVNENGNWLVETRNPARRWYFGIEALISETKGPGSTYLGNRGLPFNPVKAAYINRDRSDFFDEEGDGFFDQLVLSQAISDVDSLGLRSRIGFWNADETGIMIEGHFVDEGDESFARGNLNPIDFFDLTNNDDRRAWLGLPIRDETEVGLENFSGLRFDKYYRVDYRASNAGLGISFYQAPAYRLLGMNVRPQFGVRYLRVRETLAFHGVRTNILEIDPINEEWIQYTGDPDQDPTPPVDITPGEYYFNYEDRPPFGQLWPTTHTTFNMRTESHLGGPEVGLRYDIGGDKLLIWGQSKIGVLANAERLRLDTYQIGDEFSVFDPDPVIGTGSDFSGQTRFSTKRSSTHVSPMFEQTVVAEAKIFHWLPLFKKVRALQRAKAKFGYTFTLVGEVSRPADSYLLKTVGPDPVNPNQSVITPKRSTWWTQNFSFGIDWPY